MLRTSHPDRARRAGVLLFLPLLMAGALGAQTPASGPGAEQAAAARLTPPETGPMRVGFVVSRGADVIDFTGPWEVFQNVIVPGRGTSTSDTRPFRLALVGASRAPIRVSGGMHVVPDVTFSDAPDFDVIVVPAQGTTPAMLAWLRAAHAEADLTMSVCTGAFVLAEAGLLDGWAATTHHASIVRLEGRYPSIDVRRDVRWVEAPRVATAAGLTSGIDLALRVVARYFGDDIAERTATYMEHASTGWRHQAGAWVGARDAALAAAKPKPSPPVLGGLDPVVLAGGEEAAGKADLWADHAGYRYRFVSTATRQRFLADPDRYGIQLGGACAFMAGDGAPPGSGDPDRFLVHDGRIYIFATEGCRTGFRADPQRYIAAAVGGG